MTYTARIIKAVGGRYTALFVRDGAEQTLLCSARGIFRKDDELTPLAGDVAEIVPDENDDELGSIISIYPRKNSLIRPAMANLDLLFIVLAPTNPPPALVTIDKLTCIAHNAAIKVVMIINKMDLADTSWLASIYRTAGFDVFCVSGTEREGISGIYPLLNGTVSAFAGASGVGKSSIINALFPQLQLSTNTTSAKIQRGRHTTREVRLFKSEYGGYIADTPGFSLLDFTRFDFFELEELADSFPEFTKYLGDCRYKKCTHTKEEGCALLEAVGRGEVMPSRHESYVQLFDELKKKKPWDKKNN